MSDQNPSKDKEVKVEWEEPKWWATDLAERLVGISRQQLRNACQQGQEKLEEFLREVIGSPPAVRWDSGNWDQEFEKETDRELAVSMMLGYLSEEERAMIRAAILKIDPSGVLVDEFDYMGSKPPGDIDWVYADGFGFFF